MFILYFCDSCAFVSFDLFFDVIGFYDSKFYVTVILSRDKKKLFYYVSQTDDIPDYDDTESLWSLVGICTDSDIILKYCIDNGY